MIDFGEHLQQIQIICYVIVFYQEETYKQGMKLLANFKISTSK
jgi:hypothetical protein